MTLLQATIDNDNDMILTAELNLLNGSFADLL
jgi:hypothetical protein